MLTRPQRHTCVGGGGEDDNDRFGHGWGRGGWKLIGLQCDAVSRSSLVLVSPGLFGGLALEYRRPAWCAVYAPPSVCPVYSGLGQTGGHSYACPHRATAARQHNTVPCSLAAGPREWLQQGRREREPMMNARHGVNPVAVSRYPNAR